MASGSIADLRFAKLNFHLRCAHACPSGVCAYALVCVCVCSDAQVYSWFIDPTCADDRKLFLKEWGGREEGMEEGGRCSSRPGVGRPDCCFNAPSAVGPRSGPVAACRWVERARAFVSAIVARVSLGRRFEIGLPRFISLANLEPLLATYSLWGPLGGLPGPSCCQAYIMYTAIIPGLIYQFGRLLYTISKFARRSPLPPNAPHSLQPWARKITNGSGKQQCFIFSLDYSINLYIFMTMRCAY